MAAITVSDQLKARVEARATAEGFGDVEAYLHWLVDGTEYEAPSEVTVASDAQLQALVDQRLDGPWIDADAADFARIKARFTQQQQAGRSGDQP